MQRYIATSTESIGISLPLMGAQWNAVAGDATPLARKRSQGAWEDMNMGRKAGDRYACSECGSTIVYEKDCPCCSESAHAELCCDKPMDKVPA